MNEALNRVGKIELLESQIKNLNVQENQTSYWTKLDKLSQSLSSDQQEYINTNEEVKNSYSQMMEAFNLFLFETQKEQFASNPLFTIYCDKYIDSVYDTLNSYQNNMSELRREYGKLKDELAQIKKGGYCED